MSKPQKADGPKIYQAFDEEGDTRWWTCWQKADGERTRGWGSTPNEAHGDWLYRTLIAEGMHYKDALKRVAENDFA